MKQEKQLAVGWFLWIATLLVNFYVLQLSGFGEMGLLFYSQIVLFSWFFFIYPKLTKKEGEKDEVREV